MKRLLVISLTLIVLTVLGIIYSPHATWAAFPQDQAARQTGMDEAVKEAFMKAVDANRLSIMAFTIYTVTVDRVEYSKDGTVALIYQALKDPLTDAAIAVEPGISIAHNAANGDPTIPDSWQVKLQSAPDFRAQVEALPPELLTDDIKMRFLVEAQPVQPENIQVFTGYKLPWTAGLEKRLSGSIGHVLTYRSCPDTCRYAYDFADGTMFPILAAKGGMVKSFRYGCANNDHSCTNFLVLEDQSTIPTTYQVYYHMAYNTLPERLRVIGTQVTQGEYVGDVDNTGASTGHHLHFHVYVTTTRSNWEWGYSVDFTFDDVKINGGHLRTCSEASNFPAYGTECNPGPDGKRGTSDDDKFLSGNTPAHPPSGSLITPINRQTVNTQTMTIGGTAVDDIQVTRIQVMANWGDTWRTIDNITPGDGGIFSKDVDLCAANVPEGPFTLLVKIYDREGSQAVASPGVLQLIKNFGCNSVQVPPAPPCTPGDNQVALYAEPDYRGACKKFDARDQVYSTLELGTVGDNTTASIQVGKNVQAILYDLGDDVSQIIPEGRIETFEAGDVNLADNRIGADTVSGLKVLPRSTPPDEAFLTAAGPRLDGTNPTNVDSLVLAWNGGAGATAFDVTLSGVGSWTVSRESSISVGTLAPGTYSWLVTANNGAGSNNSLGTFTVDSASLPAAAAQGVPFFDDVEVGPDDWTATGLWQRRSLEAGNRAASQVWMYNNGTDYASPAGGPPWRGGDLTSAPINIPASGVYYLNFSYYADVEDGRPYWDQRRVQILDDQGRTTDLYQLADDKQATGQVWLQSPPLSLAAFAGKTIRLRFHFNTVDAQYNAGQGWAVDDISINAIPPETGCTDSDQNDPAHALAIAMNSSVTNAAICPQGDIDYYRFDGTAGQPISVDIDAQVLGSSLDAQVFLLADDRQSVIAENDDEILGDRTDPLLTYTLQRTGTYYLKVKAWDYPGAGGVKYPYHISLNQVVSRTPRSITILSPADPKLIPSVPFEVRATAEDYNGGAVAQMEFYWHGPDWTNGSWIKVGADTNGTDGWSFIIYPLLYGDIKGSALYVQGRNTSGAALGQVMWDLEPDTVSPISQLDSLPAELLTTAVKLTWTSDDPQKDTDHFEFQYQQNLNAGGGWSGWQDVGVTAPAAKRYLWFLGQPGSSYNFRMRAVDVAGNAEKYIDFAEATTTIVAGCTPDAYEGADSTIGGSVPLVAAQNHNLCQGDQDWISFQIPAGTRYPMITLVSENGGAAFQVDLYNQDQAKIASFTSEDFGRGIASLQPSLAPGTYYLNIRSLAAGLYGTNVTYRVYAGSSFFQTLVPIMR